jgi:hypothetical protein
MQTASLAVLDQKAKLGLVLERVIQFDDCWVVKTRQHVSLDKYFFDPPLFLELLLPHLLEGIRLAALA